MSKQTYELSPQQQLLYINSTANQRSRTGMEFCIQAADLTRLQFSINEVLAGEQQLRMTVRYHAEEGIPVVLLDQTGEETLSIRVKDAADGTVLVQMDADSYFFDTWSLIAIMDKVSNHYSGQPVAPPAVDYLQFAAWRNQLLASAEESNLSYWQTKMESATRPKISFERNTGDNTGALLTYTPAVGEPLLSKLGGTSRSKEVLFLAGWYFTLWKLSGEGDGLFPAGYIHHGRSFSQLYGNTGAFSINLPFIPGAISAALTVQEYLTVIEAELDTLETQKEYLRGDEAYYRFAAAHLGYQFEYIDQDLFVEDAGFVIESNSIPSQPLKIRMQVLQQNGVFTYNYFYSEGAFTEEDVHFIVRLWEHYCIQLLNEENTTLEALPGLLLPVDEVKKYDIVFSLTEVLAAVVKKYGNKPAIRDAAGIYTYHHLDNQSTLLAAHLVREGINKGDNIGVLCDAGYLLMEAMVGILKAGATYIPVDATDSPERIAHIAADAQLRYIITQEKYAGVVTAIPDIVPLYHNAIVTQGQPVTLPERTAADIAYVIYTSGTTGKPKGVAISDSSLVNYVQWLQTDLDISSNDSSMLLSSYAFDLGYTATWGTVLSGGTIHFVDKEMLYQTDEVLKYVSANKITYLKLTPAYFGLLLNAVNVAELNNGTLRMIILGGEKINAADLLNAQHIAPGIQFVNHYGPTETTVGCIAHKIAPREIAAYGVRPVIGKAINNNTVYILDDRYNRVAAGMKGGIFIGGAGLAKGYLHQEALTLQKFIVHPQYGRLYDTGDLGIGFLNGDILFLGRSDNQVKIRGYRVEPDEVKHVLESLPGVHRAVVYVRTSSGDPSLVAFVLSPQRLDIERLKEALKSSLPDYMVPAFIVQIDEIPVTANNKTDYKQLDKLLEKKPVGVDRVYTQVESRMMNIWKEVLNIDHLEEDDNFFNLGGHSLKAIQLLSRVHREFSVKLNLKDIYKHATPKELATLVPSTQQETYEGILPVPLQERYRVSNSQKRMWLSSLRKENRHLFNVPLSYRITGRLDIGLFADAFRHLVQRHESLRTLFRFTDGDIYQYILPFDQVQFDMPLIIPVADPAEIIKDESLTPFDLENEIPIRVKILKLAEDEHVLLITLHHIISDGWSREIIYKEVISVYNSLCNNEQPSLRPLRIQYKDYVYWHEQQYASQELFWKDFFSAGIPSVAFPLDYARPAMISHNGFARTAVLDGEQFLYIRSVLEKRNINKTDFCIALFGLLLYRYTAQRAFMIGTITSGRTHVDLESMIGTFINFLPLKITVDPTLTLAEYIGVNSQEFLKIYANEDYPFDLIVEKFVQHKDYSRNPVFDATIVFHNEENMELIPQLAKGAAITEYISSADLMEVAKIDFKFDVTFRNHEMVLRLEYNTRLFSHETMIQLLNKYVYMLTVYPSLLDDHISTLPHDKPGAVVVSDDEMGELII